MVADFFNSLPYTTCQPILGALYAFPNIRFSPAAIDAARRQGATVELFYSLQLLDATGIVVSNGDGFGQLPNTHHIRFAILPKLSDLLEGLQRYRAFHHDFFSRYPHAPSGIFACK